MKEVWSERLELRFGVASWMSVTSHETGLDVVQRTLQDAMDSTMLPGESLTCTIPWSPQHSLPWGHVRQNRGHPSSGDLFELR